MPAVGHGGRVGRRRTPLVGDHGDAARSREPARHPVAVRRSGIPADGLDRFGLAQPFKQPDAVRVSVESVHVVEDDRFAAVLVGREVDAERGGVSVDPQGPSSPNDVANAPALADAGIADDYQEIQVAGGERAGVRLEFGVRRDREGVRGSTFRLAQCSSLGTAYSEPRPVPLRPATGSAARPPTGGRPRMENRTNFSGRLWGEVRTAFRDAERRQERLGIPC